MILLSIAVFLPSICIGFLLVHLLWPERGWIWLAFKACLGTGLGLGFSSLLYFVYLLSFTDRGWFLPIQLLIFAALLALTLYRERGRGRVGLPRPGLTRVQAVFILLAGIVFIVSLLSTGSYLLRRRQGDWDAWMMYNRAARFIHRDPSHWLESFSAQMDPIFHADYPLLLAMNIALGWDLLGSETPYVPMMESALFSVACLGLAVTALASVNSVGQAALGLLFLWGTPALVNEGARQLADVPLAFFMLAGGILVYLYLLHKDGGLLVLAGLAAGMAAWTKNEGSLFVIAVGIGLMVAFIRGKPWRVLLRYGLGLALPFVIVLYFKLFLAPPSDVLSNGAARSVGQLLDPSRHVEILQFIGREALAFGGWMLVALPIGILPVLLVYFLLFRARLDSDRRLACMACITILAVQALGYYAVYLITPYDLAWHLTYSLPRIFIQVFPLLVFLVLSASRTPEGIFDRLGNGGDHAAHD